jgi:hypothetical protein
MVLNGGADAEFRPETPSYSLIQHSTFSIVSAPILYWVGGRMPNGGAAAS